MTSPPNFWALFADALRISAEGRSIRAFFPWWLVACLGLPVAGVYWYGDVMRKDVNDANAVTVLSAIAVVAGFLGSVSVSSIGNVQRMVSEYPFSSYLKEEGLFDQFLFWPQFTLLCQVALLLASTAFAASMRLFSFESTVIKYMIAVDVGLLIYVCTKTWGLIDLMRKLTWHYEDYKRTYEEAKAAAQKHA